MGAPLDRQHLPPDDGGRKPIAPPPKPSEARQSVTAATSTSRSYGVMKTSAHRTEFVRRAQRETVAA
jgi:hypothetical protein